MKLPFILNNENIVIDTEPDAKLLDILRNNGYFFAKEGCKKGICGSCTVLLNDKPIPSCIIPAAAIRGCKITTLDYFMTTNDYLDIAAGFKQGDVHLCGYCNAGKIFAAYDILSHVQRPTKESIIKYISRFPCTCTEKEVLVNGIILASAIRRKRLSENLNGK